jgi:3-isopropylmalate dehydrogenase
MKKKTRELLVALVPGDGAAPEMMEWAWAIAYKAAKKDGVELVAEITPMGWAAYEGLGDTCPASSFRRAIEIGTIFFGGVGDPKLDNTIGAKKPEMKPEARCLLALRKEMGLLLNFRPVFFYKEFAHLANVRPETIPEEGIDQRWIRYLLEDIYFGNEDLLSYIPAEVRDLLGIKLKKDVRGDEQIVTSLAYYRKSTLEKYMRVAFAYARKLGLPVISIDKSNVVAHDVLWRKTAIRIGEMEFPDVPLRHQYVDSANEQLFTPGLLRGVIIGGNLYLDVLSDGANKAMGSLGMMHSSAINPDTGAAMFESGAGTAPTLVGTNTANIIGRTLAGAMMLEHRACPEGAKSIRDAVKKALMDGWRTLDMCGPAGGYKGNILGTREMGQLILSLI